MSGKKQTPNIKELPQDERPRERLLSKGPNALSNTELLAILLRTGSANEDVMQLATRLLSHYGGLRGLARADAGQLQQIKGLGEAKIAQLMAALELANRLAAIPPDARPVINSAADAARLVREMGYLPQEQVRVILLDTGRRVVGIPTIYIGTVNMSLLRVAEIYRDAITRNCPAIILVHNHPSGDPSPSPEDVEMTRTIAAAGRLLDIQLVDHLIIGYSAWRSLKELGLYIP